MSIDIKKSFVWENWRMRCNDGMTEGDDDFEPWRTDYGFMNE